MTATVTEEKQLKMHNNLLKDVISRQAGTLEKGILEGTMNSIEAGASRVDILFEVVDGKATLCIIDDGKGISTEKEIVEHFETFGTPHIESENKTWAQFRMGRGQLFAFGHNVWETSTFKMEVDINKWGLTYHLTQNLKEAKGCSIVIDLYKNPIGTWSCPSIDALQEKIKKQIEFVGTPVYFNNKQLNMNPQDLEWDFEDEYAYYSFMVGTNLDIYNLGAFVKSVPTYITGTSGIIVSKQMLGVNFARNDIQSDCSVYKAIQEIILKNRVKKTKKNYKVLRSYEREALLRDFRDGSIKFSELRGKRIFRTSQNKWVSFNMITNSSQPWTFAPDGCRKADMVMEQGSALCLSTTIVYDLNYTGEKAVFFDWLLKEQLRIDSDKKDYQQNICSWERDEIQKVLQRKIKSYIPYDREELIRTDGKSKCLSDGFSSEYLILPPNKLKKTEKRILSVLENYRCWSGRKICIGTSGEASAWTDGETYIALERSWLKKLSFSSDYSITELFTTLCHELAHNNDTEGTHIHSSEFYEEYYNITHKGDVLSHILRFKKSIQNSRIEEKREAEEKKAKEIKEKRDSKLGIAASVK